MWVKQCHKLPTGNGKHTTYQNGDDWGVVSDCLNHISHIFSQHCFFFFANLYAALAGFNESEFYLGEFDRPDCDCDIIEVRYSPHKFHKIPIWLVVSNMNCIFHIWDVILPIDEFHHFSRWLLHHQPDIVRHWLCDTWWYFLSGGDDIGVRYPLVN